MAILINRQDIERVIGAKPDNLSLAAAYFKDMPLRNSTHISVMEFQREYGNIPVVVRGDTGVKPLHGASVSTIVPMPIEIDDSLTAVQMDEYERASAMGKQQIVDQYISEHFDMIRQTINALCAQAHRCQIDYMMKPGGALVRYKVEYGALNAVSFGNKLSVEKMGTAVKNLSELRQEVNKAGVGGPVEFIASSSVFARYVDLAAQSPKEALVGDGYVMVGSFKVFEDNDSYTDIAVDGTKTVKTMLNDGEVLCRAVNAGQKMPFLRLDDTIQREAVPMYTFTAERSDQRGTEIYSKSKPFPMINPRGIAIATYIPE